MAAADTAVVGGGGDVAASMLCECTLYIWLLRASHLLCKTNATRTFSFVLQ